MTTKTRVASPPNPADLPLTRGQAKEFAAEIMRIIQLVATRTNMNDAQWQQALDRLITIITRVSVEPAQPYQPRYQTDEEMAAQRAALDEERSGERLREAYNRG